MEKYSDHSSGVVTGGISLPTVLFLIFLVLKLCGVISWSWWWITAPLWGSVALGLLIIIGIVLVFTITKAAYLCKRDKKNKHF